MSVLSLTLVTCVKRVSWAQHQKYRISIRSVLLPRQIWTVMASAGCNMVSVSVTVCTRETSARNVLIRSLLTRIAAGIT